MYPLLKAFVGFDAWCGAITVECTHDTECVRRAKAQKCAIDLGVQRKTCDRGIIRYRLMKTRRTEAWSLKSFSPTHTHPE